MRIRRTFTKTACTLPPLGSPPYLVLPLGHRAPYWSWTPSKYEVVMVNGQPRYKYSW